MFTFLNQGAKITMKIRSSIIAITTLAVIATVITALTLGSFTAQAQSQGAVPNLQISSTSPAELTITWDSPNPIPADYRLRWAEASLDFLSYSASNEANRGSEYPHSQDTSMTLTGPQQRVNLQSPDPHALRNRRRQRWALEWPVDQRVHPTSQ